MFYLGAYVTVRSQSLEKVVFDSCLVSLSTENNLYVLIDDLRCADDL